MNLYTRWVERDGGVYVQVEFLALSRSIPAFFAPLVNPYVHSIPREYPKRYLETTPESAFIHRFPPCLLRTSPATWRSPLSMLIDAELP